MSEPNVVTITTYEAARDAFRHKQLRQALYDAGEVVMADVLVNLHGEAHRARRRLENRLFRRDSHARYERDLFPPIVAETLAPHVEQGRAELVGLSHQMMMNLAAFTAGVDRPQGTPEETFHLYSYMMRFIEGATLAHYTGDREAKRAEVAAALESFDGEFLQPSIARRLAALARSDAGEITEDDLPRDVLTVLLRNRDDLELPAPVVLRETCFYLLAGAHTSATAFVRALHAIFAMAATAPADAEQAATDLAFLQRCVQETVRLQPSSPVAMRWALADIDLRDGQRVAAGDKVVIDLMAANRDPSVFGADADRFDPHRELPDGVGRAGLSFGSGMHACIGQELAAGVESAAAPDGDQLYGLVPVAVQAVLRAGARPDPQDPPRLDPESARGYWATYPVVFTGPPRG
ncbi:MAG: cytochrome P450 [Acidimicrobiales bacterium]|jgi:cytochrome P450|nr:cytochrome P450 [Acidimicrobiales bacterium]